MNAWTVLRMAEALALIAARAGENHCENTVDYHRGEPCTSTCRGSVGRTRRATYRADQWCDACVAADALGYPRDAHRNLRMVRGEG